MSVAKIPTLITTGNITNHISITVLKPDLKNDLNPGALSITQLIYLSEVGGVILGSKIPVSIFKLFVIFLIRTIIALPIIALMAHLYFN